MIPPPPAISRFVMPWGKYRGVPVDEIPDAYLAWALSEANLYGAVKAAMVREWHRRASRRRSWVPVVKAKWGRRVLSVLGRGPFAVVQPCGGFGMYTFVLCPTLDQARAKQREDCGWEGDNGCQVRLHYVFDLAAMTGVPGEAIE